MVTTPYWYFRVIVGSRDERGFSIAQLMYELRVCVQHNIMGGRWSYSYPKMPWHGDGTAFPLGPSQTVHAHQ